MARRYSGCWWWLVYTPDNPRGSVRMTLLLSLSTPHHNISMPATSRFSCGAGFGGFDRTLGLDDRQRTAAHLHHCCVRDIFGAFWRGEHSSTWEQRFDVWNPSTQGYAQACVAGMRARGVRAPQRIVRGALPDTAINTLPRTPLALRPKRHKPCLGWRRPGETNLLPATYAVLPQFPFPPCPVRERRAKRANAHALSLEQATTPHLTHAFGLTLVITHETHLPARAPSPHWADRHGVRRFFLLSLPGLSFHTPWHAYTCLAACDACPADMPS